MEQVDFPFLDRVGPCSTWRAACGFYSLYATQPLNMKAA